MSEALEIAETLFAMDPLPDDAEEQIEALAKQAPPEEQLMFDWLAEGLFTRRCSDPDTIPMEPPYSMP